MDQFNLSEDKSRKETLKAIIFTISSSLKDGSFYRTYFSLMICKLA